MICQVITQSMSCNPSKLSSHLRQPAKWQALHEKIQEQRRIMNATRPENVRCPDCGAVFSPSWDRVEGRWEYPEVNPSGICHSCQRLREIRENIEACLCKAGVPCKYSHCSFDNFRTVKENQFCIKACGHYIAHHSKTSPGLYLYGSCGTGKTHLAAAITRQLLLLGKQVMFTCVPMLCLDIKKAFNENSRITEQDAIQAYVSCEYLVLDDLGVEKTTEWVKKTLGYIIYERDNMYKPTIITSNYSLDELSEQTGQRTASRIAGMSQVIRILGPDWRLKKSWREGLKAV